jgi:hypothetical protein
MGIATTLLWILLIAFFVSAVYSIKDVDFRLDFSRLSTPYLTADNKLVFSVPVNISNRGFYDLGSFNMTTVISDEEGSINLRDSTFVDVVRKGENVTTFHNISLNVDSLLQNYLFNDTSLKIKATIGMSIAKVIPIQVATSQPVPWSAPISNLSVGLSTPRFLNMTHVLLTVSISFENRNDFVDVGGFMKLRGYNDANVFLGESQARIDASRHSSCNTSAELPVRISDVTGRGYFEVYFVISSATYGPKVFPYG